MTPLIRSLTRWLLRLAVLGALVAAAFFGQQRYFPKKPLLVRAARVERGPVRDVVTSSTAGEVVPERHATARAERGGRVTVVRRRRGERVKRGELVVGLDDSDPYARLSQARAQLPAAAAQVGAAKARIATLEKQLARAQALCKAGASPQQLADDAENALLEAREQLKAQEGLYLQAEAAVKVANVGEDHVRLVAPFDGLLVEVLPDLGDELPPGAPVFEVIDDSAVHVNANVDEADAARVALGQLAELTLDALPGKRIEGRITRIAPAVKRDLKGARTLGVEVGVSDLAAATKVGLKPGMSANVEVVVTEKADAPWLPTHVIVGRGVKRTVYRIDGGVARQVPVEVGLGNWDRTEILGGVAVGDVVISTLNVKGLEDGSLVTVESN